MAEDFVAGFREGVVVDTAGIAQQGAVDVEKIGVVLVPEEAGAPSDTALRSDIRTIDRRDGWSDGSIL